MTTGKLSLAVRTRLMADSGTNLPARSAPTYSLTVDSALAVLTVGAIFHDDVCELVLVRYLVNYRKKLANEGCKRSRDDYEGGDKASCEDEGSREYPQEVPAPTAAKRANLRTYSDDVYAVLKGWMCEHLSSPYPSEKEKQVLMNQTGLTLDQVNNWMSNTRRRVLRMHGQRKK